MKSELVIRIQDRDTLNAERTYKLMKRYRPSFDLEKGDAEVLLNLLAGELGYNLVPRRP